MDSLDHFRGLAPKVKHQVQALRSDSPGIAASGRMTILLLVLPEVVEITQAGRRIVPSATEDPEISRGIDPTAPTPARPGNIVEGGGSFRSVNPRLIVEVSAAHPCPLARAVSPQVVEAAPPGRTAAESAEEP